MTLPTRLAASGLWGLLVLTALPGVEAQEPPAPEMAAPTGAYQIAWLMLEKGWEGGEDLRLFLGIRGGQATAVWYCAPTRRDCHHMWVDEITVKLAGGRLKGETKGRMVKAWAPIAHVGDYVFELDAKVSNGRATGTFAATIALKGQAAQTTTGSLTGTMPSEERLKKDQGFPPGRDWPGYYGAGWAFRGPDCGVAMIDDLGDAKPMWKAEEPLPCMWGRGPDGRYKHRACVVGVDGGASSPVVAEGMVYCFYFRPSGEVGNDEQLRREAAQHTSSPIGQRAYVDWHRPLADDIVVGMDAATGRTVWKTVLKGRSINLQTHKWRGYNPVPFVANGIVYVVNYSDRVYALDAKTGKLAWEYGKAAAKRFAASAAGPVVADGVVAVCLGGKTLGLDAKSGGELWKGPGGNMLVWRKGARERIIACAGGRSADPASKGTPKEWCMHVWCVEPKTGEAAWRAETPLWGVRDVYPLIDGDCLVGFEATKGDKPGQADFGRDTQVLCYRLRDDGLERVWSTPAPYPAVDKLALTIANGHVYIDGFAETFCLKLATGERVGSAEAGGARTQLMFAADGRVFIQPEGRHGGQSFFMLDADPKNFRVLGARWVPPHTHDTAYANHPVAYPVVDGRLFVRGHDGLYCYDLRARPLGATRRQQIDFPPLPNVPAGSTQAIELAASGTSGLPVRYRVVEGPARIEGGKLVPTGETGIVTIVASQPGNQTWIEAKPVTRYLAVGKAAPNAPSSLRAWPVSDTRIRITWADASEDELGFRVYRREGGGNWQRVAEVPRNATTLTDAGLKAHTLYGYRVTAYNQRLESAPAGEGRAATYSAAVQYFVEAEAMEHGRKWRTVKAGGVSGGAYLEATDDLKNPQASPPGRDDILTFQACMPVAGDYRLCGRNLSRGGGSNSFHARIDKGPWQVWAVEEGGWRFTLGRYSSVLFRDVQPGVHTVAVSIREKGTGADKFCLRSDSDGLPPPKGLGGKALQPGKMAAPAPPRNVQVSRTKAGHATLAWQPGGVSLAGFVIERRTGDAKFAPVDFVPADATSWTDPILLPAAAQYRVRAFGPGGPSEPAGR